MKKFALLLTVIFSLLFFQSVYAYDYTVTTVSNSGAGSLPDLLNQALNNQNPNNGSPATPNRILFNIPVGSADADGKYVISLNNGLNINRTIIIDGTTQPGYVCEPLIVLRGNGGGDCFTGNGATIDVKGFIIQNWQKGFNFYQNTQGSIKTCWIGLDNTGTAGNTGTAIREYGIYLGNNSSNMIIGGSGCEGNVISNIRNDLNNGDKAAIYLNELNNNGSSISIKGNFIGTDKSGTIAVENGKNYPLKEKGIWVHKTHSVVIDSNIVSNTSGNGIFIFESNNGVVKGNIIGLDKSGAIPMGNKGAGIRADNSTNIIIGGTTAAERNIISANGGAIDARPCGQVYCGEPCRENCPDKYDATLQCGIYFTGVRNSFVRGNYIGTDGSGNTTGTNNRTGNLYAGVKFEDGSTGNTIGGPDETYRNIIGGNGFDIDANRESQGYQYKGHGIQLNKASVQSTTISNNYIGVGANGTSKIGNRQDGISLLGSSNNTITKNVIADNAFGIFAQSDFQNGTSSGQPTNNTITGNFIGTDPTGLIAMGNGVRNQPGVVVDTEGAGIGIQHGSTGNIIGGTTAADRNIISGNYFGVMFRFGGAGNSNTPPINNSILGNYIGVDATGETALPNTADGISIGEGASNTTVGGVTATAANVISGNNGSGVDLSNGDGNRFFGNRIGISATGLALANNGDGIRIQAESGAEAALGSIGNIIGGPLAGQANTISNNAGNGIAILDAKSINNSITRNSISCNALRGIELNGLGNGNFAAPAIQSNSTDEILRGTAPANSYIEIFRTDNCGGTCFPGNLKLQGVTFVGTALANATGDWTFTQPTPADYTLFTATASQTALVPTAAVAYNTSEFSSCVNVCEAVTSVALTAPKLTICSDEPIPAFTAVATGGVPRPLTFQWYRIDGGVSTPVNTDTKTDITDTISVFTPTVGGVYNVEVTTALPGCTTLATAQTLIINNQPSFTLSPSTATNICLGESVDFNVTVDSPIAGTYTYDWSSDPAGQPLPSGSGSAVSPTVNTEYSVIVTSPQGCKDTSVAVPVTVNPLPDASITASGPLSFCEIVDSVTLNAVKDANYSYQWKNGSSTIPAPQGIADSLVVKSSGSYTVVVTNTVTGCKDSTATGTDVNVFPSPILTLTPNGNTTTCIGSQINVIATGTGTFAWFVDDVLNPDSTGTSYLAKTDGEYKVVLTNANGCKSSDSVSIEFNDDKIAFISAEANEFCEDDSVKIEVTTQLVSLTKWYFNDVLIPGASGLEYYAKQAGSYKAYVETSVGCKDTSAAVSIDINLNPVVANLQASSTELCADDTVTVTATPGSGTAPYEYTWSPATAGSDQSSFDDVPADTTTYSVIITDSKGCSSDEGTVTVNVKERPVVNPVSVDADGVCLGDSTDLNAQPSGGSGSGYTFVWAPAASLDDVSKQNPNAKPTVETEYSVVVTDGASCSSDTAFVTVVVLSNPVVNNLVAPDSICFEESFALSADITPASGNYSYNWIGNGLSPNDVANPNATPNADGTFIYELIVTDENGCRSDTADHSVKVNPKPLTPVILSPDQVVCFGDSVEIELTNPDLTVYTVDWFKDGVAFESDLTPVYALSDGNYTVVITNKTTGCISDASNTVAADILPEPSDLTISGGGTFCDYEIEQRLNAVFDSRGFDYTITWFKDGNNVGTGNSLPFQFAADSGSYRAEITYTFNGEPCSYESASNAEVIFRPIPVIEASSDPTGAICAGSEVQLQSKVIRSSFDITNTDPDHSFFEFRWVGEILVDSLYDSNFVHRDTINIDAKYKRYFVTVIDLRNGCVEFDSVGFDQFVDYRIADDTLDLCLNSFESILTIDSSTTPVPLVWSFENNPPKYAEAFAFNIDSSVVTVKGIATVSDMILGEEYYYLNAGQCTKIDSVLLRVHPLPVVELVSDLDTICVATQVTLSSTAANGTPFASTDRAAKYNIGWYYYDSTAVPTNYVQFNEDDTQDSIVNVKPTIVPEQIYYVSVVDSMGCAAYDSIILHPQPKQNLVVPNLITPNGDNRNEVLVIKDKDTGIDIFPGAVLEVYNRWGQAVYKSKNYENNWGGQNCTEGVYYYTLDAGCGDDTYKGWVQIMSNEN